MSLLILLELFCHDGFIYLAGLHCCARYLFFNTLTSTYSQIPSNPSQGLSPSAPLFALSPKLLSS